MVESKEGKIGAVIHIIEKSVYKTNGGDQGRYTLDLRAL